MSEAAIALQHLSAVVSAITVAYVGFDHFNGGADEAREQAMEAARKDAQRRLTQLGFPEGVPVGQSKRFKQSDTLKPLFAICVIAQEQARWFDKPGLEYHCYAYWFAPLWPYFTSKWHAGVVGAFAAASIFIFLKISYALVVHETWISNGGLLLLLYWLLTGMALWVIICSAISLRLTSRALKITCEHLHGVISDRLAKYKEEIEETLVEFEQNNREAVRSRAPVVTDPDRTSRR
jgi:hypothetical protein